MNIKDAFPSKYLKASDVVDGTKYKISNVTVETMSEGRQKPIVHFAGASKPLVLNQTNARRIELVPHWAKTRMAGLVRRSS